jgi:hypothetical protein
MPANLDQSIQTTKEVKNNNKHKNNLSFILKIQCYLIQVISYLIKALVFLKVLYILYYSMRFKGCLNH